MSHQYRLGVAVELLPAAFLLGIAALVGLLGRFRGGLRPSFHRWLSSMGFLGAIGASLIGLYGMRFNPTGVGLVTFGGAIVADRFGVYAEIVICAVGLIAVLGEASAGRRLGSRSPAFFALVLTATAAGTLLAGQHEMAMLVLGVGLLILSLVSLVALEKTSAAAAEVAFRTLVGAGVALAVLIYGLTVMYGATGSTDLSRTRGAFTHGGAPLEGLGVSLCLIGLVYLMGAFPLHRWVLHVATASSGAVAAAVLSLAGTAGAIALVRVTVSGFGAGLRPWLALASLIAAVGCLYPAAAALGETSLRRLAGLGAILQAGLLLSAALGSGTGADLQPAGGVTALLFAVVIFAVAVLACFQAVALLEAGGIAATQAGLRGLGRRFPGTAALLCLGLAGLAGLPPLAGFVARILIAESTVAGGYAWVAVVGVAASAIYVVPVLRTLVLVFLEDSDAPVVATRAPRSARLIAATCAILGIAATLLAQPLLFVANGAAAAALR